jgi:hypothetical protein
LRGTEFGRGGFAGGGQMSLTERYVKQAFADNGVVELRHQDGSGRWISGLFDDADDLLAAAGKLHQVGNLFISLNRPSPRKAWGVMGGTPLGNADFQWITRMFMDFDPIRPKDTASTDAELEAAKQTALDARKVFKALNWPDPLLAISGNGAHLLYRTHLPNTAEVRDMLTLIYTGMSEDHVGSVKFDRAVRNAGRIGPLYGSFKRKGPNTAERPHRKSVILEWPREWKQIQRTDLEKVVRFYGEHQAKRATRAPVSSAARFSGSGDYQSLDMVAWFTAHGLYRRPLGTYSGAERHAVRCPWEGEHSNTSGDLDTSTVIFTATEGWPGFHCSHDHCEGRTIRDVMQILGDADSFCTAQWGGRHV